MFRKKYWDPPNIAWRKINKPIMLMMVGIPGSGKSSIAEKLRQNEGFIVHSSDELRKELFGDENDQQNNNALFVELHKRIKADLKDGKNVIYDATNIKSKNRIAFLRELKNIECQKCAYIIPTPYKQCLKNNKKRKRSIPTEVITRMYKSFQVPYYTEGFDEIFIDKSGIRICDGCARFFKKLCRTKQDNPHHALTIGEHCRKTYDYCWKESVQNLNVMCAALMHDTGKLFCKTFTDSKGNKTKYAHFYGHENVSAYLAFELYVNHKDKNLLHIAFLINNHMRLVHVENMPEELQGKQMKKMVDMFGTKIVDELYMLREADKYAAK